MVLWDWDEEPVKVKKPVVLPDAGVKGGEATSHTRPRGPVDEMEEECTRG